MRTTVIGLDADGVLLDYHRAYARAWAKAFGALPSLKDVHAYWPWERWKVERLHGEKLGQFRAAFDYEFWSTLPALPGAVDACWRLVDAGYELVCVCALDGAFTGARRHNLKELGFPIDRVLSTAKHAMHTSPKAADIQSLGACAFVDDYLPYFRGMPPGVHKALIRGEPNGSPNAGLELSNIDSQHHDLGAFAEHWLATMHLQMAS